MSDILKTASQLLAPGGSGGLGGMLQKPSSTSTAVSSVSGTMSFGDMVSGVSPTTLMIGGLLVVAAIYIIKKAK